MNVRQNLAVLTEEPTRRAALFQSNLQTLESTVGPAHPMALTQRLVASIHERDPQAAERVLEPACEGWQRYHPDDLIAIAQCLSQRALLHAEQGERERALATYLTRSGLVQAHPEHPEYERQLAHLGHLAAGYGALLGGRPDDAAESLRAALVAVRAQATTEPWWIREFLPQIELGLGLAARTRGQTGIALTHMRTALDQLESLVTETGMVHHQRWRAWVAMELDADTIRAARW